MSGRRARARERGQVLPLVALAIFAIFGMAALAIDAGYWRYQQRLEQTAADSAAMAAAVALAEKDPTCASSAANSALFTAAGQAESSINGFTDDAGATTTVTINQPPKSGAYAGVGCAIEAIVSKKQPSFFAGIFGIASTVSTRAVAAESTAGRSCVYVMQPAGLTINGGAGGFLAPSCQVQVNGTMTVNGGAEVDSPSIGYTTGGSPKGGAYPQATPASAIPVPDPCTLSPGCAYLAANPPANPGSAAPAPTVNKTTGVTTYYPGEYAATFSPASNSVLSPGLYVLDKGLSAKGGAGTLSGTGVTIYNRSGSITVGGNESLDLSAPASGNDIGVVFYQPASNTSGITYDGAAGSNGFAGLVYFPTAALTLDGTLPSVTTIVAGSMTIDGGGITITGTSAVPGFAHFVLAE